MYKFAFTKESTACYRRPNVSKFAKLKFVVAKFKFVVAKLKFVVAILNSLSLT